MSHTKDRRGVIIHKPHLKNGRKKSMKITFIFRHNEEPKQTIQVDAADVRSGFHQALNELNDDNIEDLDTVEVVTEDQLDMQMIFDRRESIEGKDTDR